MLKQAASRGKLLIVAFAQAAQAQTGKKLLSESDTAKVKDLFVYR